MKLKKPLLLFSAVTIPAVSIIGTLSCSIYNGDRIINTTENSFKGIYQGISRLVKTTTSESEDYNYESSYCFSFDKPAQDNFQAFIAWKSMNYHYEGHPYYSNYGRKSLMYFSGIGKQMLFINGATNKETLLIAKWPLQNSGPLLNAQINAALEWEGTSDQYNPFSSEEKGTSITSFFVGGSQPVSAGKTKFIGPAFHASGSQSSQSGSSQSSQSGSQSSLYYESRNAIPTFFTHDQGLYVMKVSLKMIELLSKKTSTHFPFDISTQSYIMSLVTYINHGVANFDFSNSTTVEAAANFLIDINKRENNTALKKKSSITEDNIKKIDKKLALDGYFNATTMKQAALKIIKQPRNSDDTN